MNIKLKLKQSEGLRRWLRSVVDYVTRLSRDCKPVVAWKSMKQRRACARQLAALAAAWAEVEAEADREAGAGDAGVTSTTVPELHAVDERLARREEAGDAALLTDMLEEFVDIEFDDDDEKPMIRKDEKKARKMLTKLRKFKAKMAFNRQKASSCEA